MCWLRGGSSSNEGSHHSRFSCSANTLRPRTPTYPTRPRPLNMPSHSKAVQRHPLALTVTSDGAGGGGSSNHNHNHTRHHNSNNSNNSNNNNCSSSNSNSSPSGERVEWSRSTILGFIEDYRRQRVLWDPNTKGYHIKQIKYEALKQLGAKYGTEIRSIRSKIKSLRSSFHREHGKVINGQRRGVHYQPMWFAYEAIHFILDGEQPQQQQQHQPQPQQLSEQQQEEQQQQQPLESPYDNKQQRRSLANEGGVESALKKRNVSVGADDVDKDDDDIDADGDGGDDDAVGDVNVHANGVAVHTAVQKRAGVAANTSLTEMHTLKRRHSASGGGGGGVGGGGNNNFVAAAESSDDEERVGDDDEQQQILKNCDSDAEMQHFGNLISAEDVKTELIESDSLEVNKSPLAYLSLMPTNLTVTGGLQAAGAKKRKRTPLPDVMLLAASHSQQQHQQQQQQQQQQQRAETHSAMANNKYLALNAAGSRGAAQEPSSTTGATVAATATATAMATAMATPAAAAAAAAATSMTATTSSKANNGSLSTGGAVDEYGVFGEYVAITIRKLKTSKAKIVVKHLINNLLYEAELGNYDDGIPACREPPQLYKT